MQVERLPVRIQVRVNGTRYEERIECLLPLRVGTASRKIQNRCSDLHQRIKRPLALLSGPGIHGAIEEHALASQFLGKWIGSWDRPEKGDRADFVGRISYKIAPPPKDCGRLRYRKELRREH